ncbi:hypothetical protein KCP91_17030 [Microvirga sp. SRT01]|uniref:Cysteine-rich domain-containing protein n=1 Tax=Sphingomonas longa TaxID=2778730 RepID=A0ABS2DAX9_9SPHN|nr:MULTISPECIES: hypothetical protein [Alphaproteobacteria]MBM6578090.1 hypothetical protein [Sphingomonas sp. BT552]MBR7711131.1 hypothetical protein [Microvirga sp. SRT01]
MSRSIFLPGACVPRALGYADILARLRTSVDEFDLRSACCHGTFHDVAGTGFNDAVLPGATKTLVELGLTPQAVRALPQTVF